MTSRVRFVHAADLHLDAPFQGIAATDARVGAALADATKAVTAVDFGLSGLTPDEETQLTSLLSRVRLAAGDFSADTTTGGSTGLPARGTSTHHTDDDMIADIS